MEAVSEPSTNGGANRSVVHEGAKAGWCRSVCGRVSGNLEGLDIDERKVYEEFRRCCEAAGLGKQLDRIESGYTEDTPRGGLHHPSSRGARGIVALAPSAIVDAR